MPGNFDDVFVADTFAHPGSQPESLSEELFCPECGYDLRGAASERCPECGLAIDRAAMSVSRIPWVHRREIGRFRAYWRTTWLVMVHRRRFVEEMNRPVTLSDARRFWLLTVFLAWLPIAAWAVGFAVTAMNWSDFHQGTRLGWCLQGMILVAGLFALWLYLLLATGSVTYWFHPRTIPRSRQNRAIILSYYTCAPLGWMWLPALLIVVPLILAQFRIRGTLEQLEIVSIILPEILVVVLLVSAGLGAILLMRSVTHCGAGRTAAMTIGLPVSWWLLMWVVGMIPLAALLISFAVLSLR